MTLLETREERDRRLADRYYLATAPRPRFDFDAPPLGAANEAGDRTPLRRLRPRPHPASLPVAQTGRPRP